MVVHIKNGETMTENIKCCICNNEFPTIIKLSLHLRQTHGVTSRSYYDLFIKKESEGNCDFAGCNNNTKFINITKGYQRFCCVSHAQKHPDTRLKIVRTVQRKYGRKIPFNASKCADTKKQRYGDPYYNNKEKQRKKLLNRSEDEKERWRIKVRNKWKEKTQEEIMTIQRKQAETREERGTSFSILDKVREKYGVDNPSQLDFVKDKIKQTYKNKSKQEKEITRTKRTHTTSQRYGVEHLMFIDSYAREITRKGRDSKVKKGTVLPLEQMDEFKIYKMRVYTLTRKTAREHFDMSRVSRCGVPNGLQVDHKFSVKDGFINNILPAVIANICNLQLITWQENDKKKSKSCISLNDLLLDYSRFLTEQLNQSKKQRTIK